MRYTFKIPASKTVSFQTEFQRGIAQKIMPRWLREMLGAILLGAIFVVAFLVAGKLDQALLLTAWVCLVHWLWHKVVGLVRLRRAEHYIASLPASEDWSIETIDDCLVTENRGMRISFPLSGLTRVFEEKQFVYLDFEDRGRARIPFAAFPSDQNRQEFVASMSMKST